MWLVRPPGAAPYTAAGFWLEELAAPYFAFKDVGWNGASSQRLLLHSVCADACRAVTLASPKGGKPPLDPKSDESHTEADTRFLASKEATEQLAHTLVLSTVKARACRAPGLDGAWAAETLAMRGFEATRTLGTP